MQKRKQDLEDQKSILLEQADLLKSYGFSLTGEYVAVDKIFGFSGLYVDEKLKIRRAVAKINEEIEELLKATETAGKGHKRENEWESGHRSLCGGGLIHHASAYL